MILSPLSISRGKKETETVVASWTCSLSKGTKRHEKGLRLLALNSPESFQVVYIMLYYF